MKRDLASAKKSLLATFCKINSVANVQGKGRDDFQIIILKKAEEIVRGPPMTGAVQKIALLI